MVSTMPLRADIDELKKITESLEKGGSIVSVLQSIFDNVNNYIIIIDKNFNVLYVNKTIRDAYPSDMLFHDKKCYETFYGKNIPCDKCHVAKILETQKMEIMHGLIGSKGTATYSATCIPLITDGLLGVIEIIEEENPTVT